MDKPQNEPTVEFLNITAKDVLSYADAHPVVTGMSIVSFSAVTIAVSVFVLPRLSVAYDYKSGLLNIFSFNVQTETAALNTVF